ncbi:MAG: D-3-phosphoglycerate dehydrogenase [Spirochaetes bacterium ADurb.Bin110]|nr:MAG: D-3-phosphoglycerate dehydrogenase [Spirochaetes bacterium ADurb.Bin110]
MNIGSFMPIQSIWRTVIEQLREEFPDHTWLEGLTPDSPEIGSLDLIIAGRIPADVFKAATSLKALFQPFTGVNHLPSQLMLERGIEVYNVHSNAFDVAERALALTLAFYGRVIEYHNDLKNEIWHGFWVNRGAEDNWDSLYGRKCSILGTGAIGQELAGLLKAFHCIVYGWCRTKDGKLPDHFDAIVPTLQEAIDSAEIIFIALPATKETENLISKDMLMGMNGKFLVNVGRGSIVDEEGLYEALKNGVLKGAAIDTWYTYPAAGVVGAPSRYPIYKLSNVVLSPHVGGSTNQASARSIEDTVANIRSYLMTGRGIWKADLSKMY